MKIATPKETRHVDGNIVALRFHPMAFEKGVYYEVTDQDCHLYELENSDEWWDGEDLVFSTTEVLQERKRLAKLIIDEAEKYVSVSWDSYEAFHAAARIIRGEN